MIEEFLTNAEISAMHFYCDCYVSMARNEGFGIPAFEAASFGNPIVVPRYSAFPDHFHDETAYMIDVPQEVPCQEMRHISILYTGDMVWGDPSVHSCRAQMRNAFEDRKTAKEKGLKAREYIGKNLSQKAIGRIVKGRLEAILKGYREI